MKEKLFFLKIQSKTGKSFIKKFYEDEITIGSSPFNHLHLPLKGTFGVHSLLKRSENVFHITKLNLNKSLLLGDRDVFSENIDPKKDVIRIDDYSITIIDCSKKHKDFYKTYKKIDQIKTEKHDKKIAKGFLTSFILTLIFLITISFWKVPDEIPIENISNRFSRLVIDPVVNIGPIAKSYDSSDGEGEGQKQDGDEGERGSKTAKTESKSLRQIVKAEGVLGALSDRKVKRQLSKMLNSSDGFGKLFNQSMAEQTEDARKLALFKGSFGTGMKGTGGGGGGTSKDVVGGLSTKGVGGGVAGYGKGSVGVRVEATMIPDEINTVIKGSLERSEIETVIKRHLPQIKYCYERELKTRPELTGKVVSFFIIGGNGTVTSSNIKESSMKNESVETCIKRRISTWVFPQPRGGGMVVVQYPFLFNSTEIR